MSGGKKDKGILSPYRVLDLTNEYGFICGKLLADLGADVIKIEKPGGDPARSIGPFYHDIPDPEKSLSWWAFNTSKRGITLNIETADGREIFKKLVRHADIVLETFAPGYMDQLGLGYSALSQVNQNIMVKENLTEDRQITQIGDMDRSETADCLYRAEHLLEEQIAHSQSK